LRHTWDDVDIRLAYVNVRHAHRGLGFQECSH
jgi:hypothetical protein